MKKREAPPLVGVEERPEKVILRGPSNGYVEDPAKLVRKMSEEEMEVLSKMTHFDRGFWEVEGFFIKSNFWLDSINFNRQLVRPQGEDLLISAKSIFIQVQTNDVTEQYLWFDVPVKDLVEPDQGDDGSPLLARKCNFEFEGPLCTASLSPPNRIIILDAGYRTEPFANKVMCYDLVACPDGTKAVKVEELPDLRAPRWYPRAVTVDGKIYVYGRTRSYFVDPGDSYVEVYDTKEEDKEEWESIDYDAEPKSLSRHIPGGLVLDDKGRKHRLFLGAPDHPFLRQSLYTFDLETGDVHLAESPFPRIKTAVTVDGFIYALMYLTCDVRVYDLAKKKWIPEPVYGLYQVPRIALAHLRHIDGNVFCLVHVVHAHEIHPPPRPMEYLQLAFTIFQVVHHRDHAEAKILASRLCLVPNGCLISECIIF